MTPQFQKTILVTKDHIDILNHVNNVIYLKWVQEIAAEHWNVKAPELLKKKYIWVVSSHFISYKKPCFLNDLLTINTQVLDDAKGALWGRSVWIKRGDVTTTEAETQWCLIDKNSGKPTRINAAILSVFK